MKELDTPLLILIFNRPDKIKLLIERLRLFKPKYLYISGDGPRQEKVSENKLCLEAQEVTPPSIGHVRFILIFQKKI